MLEEGQDCCTGPKPFQGKATVFQPTHKVPDMHKQMELEEENNVIEIFDTI